MFESVEIIRNKRLINGRQKMLKRYLNNHTKTFEIISEPF